MTPTLLKDLQDRAFKSVDVMQANAAIDEVRISVEAEGKTALSYEVLAHDAASLSKVEHQSLERLVYFVDCRGMSLQTAPGIFVSLFTREKIFFLTAADFIAVAANARGLSLEELKRRYGSNGTGAPLLIG